MARGYQLIQAQTLTSTAASITFSNIPQNFTDLVIKVSARTDASSYQADNIKVAFNGGSYSTSSTINIYGNGTSAAAETNPGSLLQIAGANGANSTASTFGNSETYIPNYTSSNNKPISAESVTENNATGAVLWLTSSLFSSSSAITSMTLAPRLGSNFVSNSTFMLYGVGGTKASGGTITADGDYTYHTFTSTSSFIPSEKIRGAEVLVIAGGASGGCAAPSGVAGGGGGAGGLVYSSNQLLIAGTPYTIIIGAGGAGRTYTPSPHQRGLSGSDSAFPGVTTAVGGGAGGVYPNDASRTALTGGSGGGGGADSGTGYTGAAGTSGQGNAGGNGWNGGGTGDNGNAGGGGGSGAVGSNGTLVTAGAGGAGLNTYVSWATATSTGVNGFYAGGGGGASTYSNTAFGAGGSGGGGAGGYSYASGTIAGTAGTANTGSGGGGSAALSGSTGGANSGSGGSGLVIIRYPNY